MMKESNEPPQPESTPHAFPKIAQNSNTNNRITNMAQMQQTTAGNTSLTPNRNIDIDKNEGKAKQKVNVINIEQTVTSQ